MDIKNFKESDLKKLVAQATDELKAVLNKNDELVKAEVEEKKEDKSEDKKDEVKADDSKKDEKKDEKDSDKGEEMKKDEVDPKDSEPAPEEDVKPEEEVAADAPPVEEGEHADQEDDLHEIYSLMGDHDLKAHYAALKAVILARAAQHHDGSEGEDAPAPEMAAAEEGGGDEMEMSEEPMEKSEEVKGLEEKIASLEKSIESLTESAKHANKVVELEKSIETISEFIAKRAAPQRKAVVSVEELSKAEAPVVVPEAEAKKIFAAMCANPDSTLTKHERNMISDYFLSTLSFDAVSHLLKKQ